MRKLTTLVTAAALLGAMACGGDSTTAPRNTIDGNWNGSGQGQGYTFSVSMSLAHTGSTVTGNGVLSAGTTSIAYTISGNYTAPTFSLTLANPAYEPANFSGTVSGKTMNGTFNGSGFSSVSVFLSKP